VQEVQALAPCELLFVRKTHDGRSPRALAWINEGVLDTLTPVRV
jgi:hypothetical protein